MVKPPKPKKVPGTEKPAEAYVQGFIDKCAAAGVDPEELVKLAGILDTIYSPVKWLFGTALPAPGRWAGSIGAPSKATTQQIEQDWRKWRGKGRIDRAMRAGNIRMPGQPMQLAQR